MELRLSVVLEHLTSDDYPGNIERFLEESASDVSPLHHTDKTKARRLKAYIEDCRACLLTGRGISSPETIEGEQNHRYDPVDKQLMDLLEAEIRTTIPKLFRIAKFLIPNKDCPGLTARFFERIARLDNDLPPFCQDNDPKCFAEVMSASWAYQFLHGEDRERAE